jgi:DNA-binding FadR family transcriptional regulator
LLAGGQLRTERQLTEDYGVTRASVRSALAHLEAAGVLTRHVGRGTFLRSATDSHSHGEAGASLSNISPADVMAVRALLEPHAMSLVVARATARDFAEMQRCLTGGEAATNYSEFEAWDLALHRRLIEASHSPLLIELYEAVETARHGEMWGRLKRRNDSAERRSLYACEHHAVVEAVRARDGDAAVAAMRTHLASVSANIFGPIHP